MSTTLDPDSTERTRFAPADGDDGDGSVFDERDGDESEGDAPWWHSAWRAAVLATALVFLGVAAGLAWASRPSHPGPSSVEVGFLQDMRVHHGQAVELALAAIDRPRESHDPAVRRLAAEVLLDQQAGIGVMTAWLTDWGQPLEADREPMTWMNMAGHPMPGLVTDEDLRQLTSMSGVTADVFFLQMLRAHHEGGIHMAEHARDNASMAKVSRFAGSMIEAHNEELRRIEAILRRLGGV
jgi:uncharacterized protein (DUF305 family)